MNNIVSIIVPVYNAEQTVSKTIDSIRTQSYKNLDIIIINDGSTDSSGSICSLYTKKDSRISLYSKSNSGVSDSRNMGIKMAKGSYLMFVDSDDILCKDAVESMMKAMTDSVDLVCGSYCDVRYKIKKKKYLLDNYYYSPKEYVPLFHKSYMNFAGPWAKLYRKTIIDDSHICFTSSISYGEDTMFVFDYLKSCRAVHTIKDIVYNHITNFNGLCSKYFPNMNYYSICICKKYIAMANYRGISSKDINDSFLQRYYYQAVNHYLLELTSQEQISEKIIETNNLFEEVLDQKQLIKKQFLKEYINNWKTKHWRIRLLHLIRNFVRQKKS